MTDFIGKLLGPYKLEAQLGKGGMATVYRAYQTTMKRYVAVKVMAPDLASDPGFVGRFMREVELIAALEHPHILPVIDYGEAEGNHYLVMRYIEGGSLDDLMKRQTLSLEEAARLVGQMASALDYAHKRGVIHRDFKPNNVLLDGDRNCYLTDFGIARLTTAENRMTMTGTIMGTPAYMSPEQGTGGTVDARSDLYSLGVVLYEMVVGRLPFTADTPASMIFQHAFQPPPPPTQFKPEIIPSVVAVITRSLAKSPGDRYQSGLEMTRAFETAIGKFSGAGTPPKGFPRPDLEGQTFVGSGVTPPPGTLPSMQPDRTFVATPPPGTYAPATRSTPPPPAAPPPTMPPAAETKPRSPVPIIAAALVVAAILGVGGFFAANTLLQQQATQAFNTQSAASTLDGQTRVAVLALSATKTPTETPTFTVTPSLTPTDTLTFTPTFTFTPSHTPTPNATETFVADRLATLAQGETNQTATLVAQANATSTAVINLAASQIALNQQNTLTAQAVETNAVRTSTAQFFGTATRAAFVATSVAATSTARARPSATRPPPTVPLATATPRILTSTPRPTLAPTRTGSGANDITGNNPQQVVGLLASQGFVPNSAGKTLSGPLDLAIQPVADTNFYRWRYLDRNVDVADFVLSTRFTWNSPGTDGECGFVVRFSEPGDQKFRFYAFTVGADDGYRVIEYDETTDSIMRSGQISGLNTKDGGSNHLLLVGIGSNFQLFANGRSVAKVELTKFATGSLAVMTSTRDSTNVECLFEDAWSYQLTNTSLANSDTLNGLNSADPKTILSTLATAKLIPSASVAVTSQDNTNSLTSDSDKNNVFYRKTVGSATAKDFVISVDVSNDFTTKTTACGVHFFGDSNNLMAFFYFPTKAFRIDAYVNKKWLEQPLVRSSADGIRTSYGTANRITVVVYNGKGTFFVNGVKVGEVDKVPLTRGAFGYYMEKGTDDSSDTCSFNNFYSWVITR
jgi:serine/threonine-protein kinase